MADQGDGGAVAPAAPAPAVVLGAQPEEPAGDAGLEEPLVEVHDAPVLDAPVPVVGEGVEDPQEEEALDGGDNQAPALDEGEVDLLTELLQELDEPEPEDVDESAVRNLMDELAQGEPKKRKIDYTLATQGPTTAGGSGAGVATLPKAGPSIMNHTLPFMVPPAGAAPPLIIPGFGLPFVGMPPVGAGGMPRLPMLASGGPPPLCPACHRATRQPNQARVGMSPFNRPDPHICLCLPCQERLDQRIQYCQDCRAFYATNTGFTR
ncbi:hypothetical protein CFC21_015784 [Triticum aestivum]|uniref:Uncharacterized protein n=2 Tax=Triticum aestivum TaxID=4565 RepID=A0A9R1DX75_WHEAT|nr:uncharacterized protein LOC119359087 [Triticum dicoccoides]XP_044452868.1 uncharacterized protein LOC123184891 [Triticum aestivum]KAF6999808.1 hypothetical protein CFC21_015784 [Triticum aestivum]